MPTRKQRRRQQKERRHEYEIVYVDEQGNELATDSEPERADAKEKPQSSGVRPTAKQPAKPAQRGKQQATGARPQRKIDPPSWSRVGRRAAIFAPIMVIVVYYLNRNAANPLRETVISSVVLVLFFLPFSFFMDTVMYRQYRKRIGDPLPPRERKPRG